MLRAPRILGTWLAILMLSACVAKWQELTPQSNGQLTLDSTKIYALVLADGDTLRVRHASVAGDSVHWTERVRLGAWVPESGGVRRTAIRQIGMYAGSGADGTTVGFGLLAVTGLLMLSFISLAQWGSHHF